MCTCTRVSAEAIAIDQDPLGRQGFRVRSTPEGAWPEPSIQIWQKPLADDSVAVVAYNFNGSSTPIKFTMEEVGFSSVTAVAVRDVFARADRGVHVGSFTTPPIARDGVGFYRLSLAN